MREINIAGYTPRHIKETYDPTPVEEFEDQLGFDGIPRSELNRLFEKAHLIDQCDIALTDEIESRVIQYKVPVHYAPFLGDDWKSKLIPGKNDFIDILELRWRDTPPSNETQQNQSIEVRSQITQTAGIYAKLQGKKLPITYPDIDTINKAAAGYRKKRIDADTFIDSLEGVYSPLDLEEHIDAHKLTSKVISLIKRFKKTTAVLGACTVLLTLQSQGSETNDTSASVLPIEESSAPDSSFLDTIGLITEASTMPVETTTTLAPTTTVTTPPTTEAVATTVTTLPQPAIEQPAQTVESKPEISQRYLGKPGSYFTKEGDTLAKVAAHISKVTGDDYDVDTIAAYNGIDKSKLQPGTQIVFKDCVAGKQELVNKGETLSHFMKRYNLTEEELHILNGGAEANSGWCINFKK